MKGGTSPGALVRLLDEKDFHQRADISFWQEQETVYGDSLYADILHHLSRIEFNPDEARGHWQSILERRDQLSGVLGRDVALRTAMLDHFLSHAPMYDDPVTVESRVLARTEQLSLMDELTGLYNRRYFNAILDKELERSRRNRRPCSLLMVDIDHFKAFNDSFGHQAGDVVLRQTARVMVDQSRIVDHVTRYGGEEFALILPRSGRDEARLVAERLRRAVEDHMFMDAGRPLGRLTVSIGTATHPLDAGSARSLISKADQALYWAKNKGRNKVCEFNQDKRRHQRFPFVLPALVRRPADDGAAISGQTVNISHGGLLYQSPGPVDVGARLETVLSDPDRGLTLPIMTRALHQCPTGGDSGFHVGMVIEPDSAWTDLYRALVTGMAGPGR